MNQFRFKFHYILGLALLMPNISWAQDKVLGRSGKIQVFAVELYTSEGCSSCPPADEWLSRFKDNKDLWTKYVPLAFHVDYWNRLGWKDGMSSDKMTERQVKVSQTWPSPRVYTPGVAVNGKELPNWAATPLPTYQPSQEFEIVLTETANKEFKVKVDGPLSQKDFTLRFAILGMGIDSNVTSGENQGRKLKHDFAVLAMDQVKMGSMKEFVFKTPKISQKPTRLAAVAWIERTGNPSPIQITGGYL